MKIIKLRRRDEHNTYSSCVLYSGVKNLELIFETRSFISMNARNVLGIPIFSATANFDRLR